MENTFYGEHIVKSMASSQRNTSARAHGCLVGVESK